MKRHLFIFATGMLGLLISLFTATNTFAFREENSLSSAATTATKDNNLAEGDINRFTTAIGQIKSYYVQSVSDKKLLENAMRGMLNGLDPHSEYLDEDSYKTLMMTTSGAFGGLGIEVAGEYGVLKVISPIDDTPAAKAGIKPGDYIVAIDGKLVNEMTMDEAIKAMRGKKGTNVQLTIIRKGSKAPVVFKLVRDEIRISSVKSQMLGDGFGYVRISEFQEPTTELMIAAIKKLQKEAGGNLKGLVLDLRNNPGGLLDTAVQVADVFLDSSKLNNKYNNLIVYTEGRLPNAQFNAKITPKGSSGDILNGKPLVVLINEGSASASEIVTGALQDYRRAVVVGVTSFGKGSVQTVLPLDETHAIKLTTALYHTPSGRLIQNKGVTPDLKVTPLQVAGNKTDNSIMAPIREFELKGHLPGKDDGKTFVDDAHDTTNLAHSDFQLYEALAILKTMAMLDQNANQIVAAPPAAAAVTKK